MYHLHTHCRACSLNHLTPDGIKALATDDRRQPVFSLGVQPLANNWLKPGEERAGYAPLEVLLCPRCALAQLSVVVRPDILYSRYAYVTSQSETMKSHFRALWRDISVDHIRPETKIKSILEIGSNDGTLLHWLKTECGVENVVGVEPAVNLVAESRRKGIQTVGMLFGTPGATALAGASMKDQAPDIIIARHVLCHVDDWQHFFAGIEALCGQQTVVAIEVPWVHDMLETNSFDQIYHEHLSYLSFRALEAVLNPTNLHLHRVIHYPIHGGAVLLDIRRKDCGTFVDPSVDHFRAQEPQDADALCRCWAAFSERKRLLTLDLIAKLDQFQATGKTVAALGASAKATVWINACGFTRKDITFVADSTPGKLYTTVPGTDIPVVDEGAILRELPDYVILWAWNFKEECLEKNKLARSKGVKFVVPIPKIEIV